MVYAMFGVVCADESVGWAVVKVCESGGNDEFVFGNKIMKVGAIDTFWLGVVIAYVQ